MIDSPHVQPENIHQMVIENNAMLTKVLHNQACMMEMICQIYQFTYKSQLGTWPQKSPLHPENRDRERIADGMFDSYKQVVADIYRKLLTKLKSYAK